MSTIRITPLGNFYANTFDEVTFNANTIYGTNYVPNSQNFSGWNGPGNTYSISNTVPAPDGTFTATLAIPSTTNNYKGLTYGITFNSPGTLSLFVKPSGAYTFFSLSNGPNSTTYFNLAAGTTSGPGSGWASSSIIAYPNGWYRLSVTQTSTQSWGTLYLQLENNSQSYTFAGDGVSGYYIWGAQLEKNLTPTIYKPTNASGGPLYNTVQKIDSNGNVYIAGAYDEVTFNPNSGVKKNLLISSSNTSNTSAWSAIGNIIVNPNVTIAPDGTFTAGKLILGSGLADNGAAYGQNPFITVLPQTYTFSLYAKAAEWNEIRINGRSNANTLNSFNTYISLVDGTNLGTSAIGTFTAGNVTTTNVGNGWWRISASFITDNITNQLRTQFYSYNLASNPGDGTSGIYIWGPQLEISNTATIYEATDGSGLPSQNSIVKVENTGNTYVISAFDEYTKGANMVQNGLIYYFDPAKPESYSGAGTVINDITKINPAGSLQGGFTYKTNNGGIITFDNANSGPNGYGTGYANTGIASNSAPFLTSNNYTLSVWCRFEKNKTALDGSGAATQGSLIGAAYFSGYSISWQTDTSGNIFGPNATGPNYGVWAYVRTSGGESGTVSYQSLVLNQWYNFVMVYNSNLTYSLYVNGTFFASTNAQPGYFQNMSNAPFIQVGGSAVEGGGTYASIIGRQYFPGSIGQALIYNRALSASEVLQNFQEMRSQYGV